MTNNRRKVAFFTKDFSIGGIEKVFLEYANALAERDFDIYFIVLLDTGSLSDKLSKKVTKVVLHVDWLRQSFFRMARAIKQHQIDYVISGAERENTVAVISNYLTGGRAKVITSQHNYMDIEASSILHNHILPWILRHSHHTFAVSYGIRDMLLEMGITENKIDVLYNPINISQIRSLAEEQISGLPDKYIVFVGRFYPVKNLPFLLRSFKILKGSQRDYNLLMVGDGDEMASLKSMAEDLGIQDDVVWTGAVANPYPYIKNCSLLVMPSTSESFSNVVVEALCLGKTVVSTRCKGPEETLKAPNYGYIVGLEEDETTFAAMMERAIKNPLPAEKLEAYSERFDSIHSINKLVDIINK